MASLDPDAAKSLELNESSWLRAARICDMGEYLVVTPIERDKKPIFVIRKGNPSNERCSPRPTRQRAYSMLIEKEDSEVWSCR